LYILIIVCIFNKNLKKRE